MASGNKQSFVICIIVTFIVTICTGSPVYWVKKPNLEPITMRYYPKDGFFTSSMKYGTIYQLKVNGTSTNSANPMNFSATEFFSHPLLNFSTGFEIDFKRNLLFICHSNPNVLNEWESPNGVTPSQWPSVYGYMSGIMIVNLTTSKIINNFDLQYYNINKTNPLYHYANDIVFDSMGNAYITDTCGGAIYKLVIDNNGAYTISIFSYILSWITSKNIPMLNGIVLELKKEAFLLVNALTTSLKNNGTSAMWKIPINNPMGIQQIFLSNVIGIPLGFDGQMFSEDGNYLYVMNEALGFVYQFVSYNNWDTLILKQTMKTEGEHPTSVAIATNGIFGTGINDSIFVCSTSGSTENTYEYPIEIFDFTVGETVICKHTDDKWDVVHIVMYSLIGVCALLCIVIIIILIWVSRYMQKQSSMNYQDLPGHGLDSPPDNNIIDNKQPILTIND
eukprot:175384_1